MIVKRIHIRLYQVKLDVCLGDYDDLKEMSVKYDLGFIAESNRAKTIWDPNTNRFFLFFRSDSEKITPGAIAHECKHMVNMIFIARSVKLDLDNDEPECYFLEWIVDKVSKIINK